MLHTPLEIIADLGRRVKARRIGLGYTQAAAAERAGVAYRTWRRLEGQGKASIEDLVRAAVALRCEEGVGDLFPKVAASSMDELLRQQAAAAPKVRQRAPSARAKP
ncbi:DNA-binding protein [Croceibacterium mercuriale]|uniref:DNA-binding protein n=1 Tax=Croceibacterium mercuriale TaxID=1572751 RepID=A0A0B2BWW6_9SPHN|nr:helix-turn-helix domain-containing protein [Croceibacterium mercuriale]KHL24138.1 DNA-binding protein [Croceibacterium mercuriale]